MDRPRDEKELRDGVGQGRARGFRRTQAKAMFGAMFGAMFLGVFALRADAAQNAGEPAALPSASAPTSESDAEQAPASSDLVTGPRWQLLVEPSVWFVSPGGDIELPGRAESTPATETELSDLNVNSPRLSPLGKIHLRYGNWQFGFMGFGFSIDRSTVSSQSRFLGSLVVAPEDRLDTGLDYASFEADVAYRIIESAPNGPGADGRLPVVASVQLLGGIRVHDVDFEVALTPGPTPRPAVPFDTVTSASETFFEPIFGVKGELEFYEQFNVHVQLSAGYLPGDQSVLSWDVVAGFAWRPIPNAGVQVGYRQLAFSLESGEGNDQFTYDGSLAGLYFGAYLRF